MASTYGNDLRLEEIGDGEQSGTWGNTTNTNLELIAEALSFGTEAITTNADTHTTTIADGATDPGRSLYLKYTGTLDSTCTITIAPNSISKTWYIENGTSGSQSIIISQGSGANVTIPTGQTKIVYSDGAGSGAAMAEIGTLGVTNLAVTTNATIGGTLDVDGTTNLDTVDIDGAVQLDATLTVGANDQGYDVILYGDTASANVTWDTSADDLIFNGAAGLIVPDGQFTLGSTVVSSTAAELNLVDGITAGTVLASKAVIVDSNKDLTGGRNLTISGELDAATLDISGDADIDGTLETDGLTVGGVAAKVAGKETIWVPAAAMYPSTTNGCSALTQVETTALRPDLKVLDFAAAADDFAQFAISFPKSYDLGTITYQPFWTVTGTDTGTVVWQLGGVAITNDETINTAFGTLVATAAKAHSGTSNDLMVSNESGAVTIAGSPADNDQCFFSG